jgi:predicted TPR repeat methyltransferase
MPQDNLQIALEHHRAGRLRQAAEGYLALLDQDPTHPDASHWLGVLAFQAGRPAQAIDLLETAAAMRPTDPAFHHNLGMANLHAGRTSEAITAFERTLELLPNRTETLFAWGIAYLVRAQPGDADAAVFAFRQAHLAGLDAPQLHQYAGVAQLAAGRAPQAIADFLVALEKNPHDPAAWHMLAIAYRQAGDRDQVRKCLNKALEIDPTLARAWYALAALDFEDANYDIAAALFKKAIKAQPDFSAAHQGLARALERAGRQSEAVAAFAQVLQSARGHARPTHETPSAQTADSAALIDSILSSRAKPATAAPPPTPATPNVASAISNLEQKLTSPRIVEFHHALAANAEIFSPAQIPGGPIKNLFDRYADHFDNHLRNTLHYNVPELIAQAVAEIREGDHLFDALDLGCGTGLCGALLRPMVKTLAGVDLSPAMIEKARARGVYDRLGVGELVATLNDNPAAFDLLTAADVFLYLGDLTPVFQAALRALRPAGLLTFTVEAGAGDRYHLHNKTLRYTHSQPYLKHILNIHGFHEEIFKEVTLRVESERPVQGYLLVLRK